MSPDFVTIGILPRLSIDICWAFLPVKTISIKFPLIGICAIFCPSLKISKEEENSLILTPDLAKALAFGITNIWGDPESKEGRILIWFPLFAGKKVTSLSSSCWTIGWIASIEGPVTSILIDLEPPTERPKRDACLTKALAPGSLNIGLIKTILSSLTLEGSFEAAPANAPPGKATKKNLSISGGPFSSVFPSHKGFAEASIFSAILRVSSIE